MASEQKQAVALEVDKVSEARMAELLGTTSQNTTVTVELKAPPEAA